MAHKITWISCLTESESIIQVVTDEISDSENLEIFLRITKSLTYWAGKAFEKLGLEK